MNELGSSPAKGVMAGWLLSDGVGIVKEKEDSIVLWK